MAAGAERNPLMEVTLTGISLPVKLRPATPMSDAELMEFSARNSPFRVERNAKGDLEIMTPLGSNGGRFEAYVIARLTMWAEEHGGVSFSSDAGFSLGDGSVLSPDASWLPEVRWKSLTKRQRESFAPICPEFVIEVRSISDSRRKLERKMGSWIGNGARLAWLVDPLKKTVTVYRPGVEAEVLERPEFVEAGEPVAGFRLECSRFWAA